MNRRDMKQEYDEHLSARRSARKIPRKHRRVTVTNVAKHHVNKLLGGGSTQHTICYFQTFSLDRGLAAGVS